MSAQELSNMVFSIKDKITDKDFKDIMDKLSIKNEEEDKLELYEFTYMKMRKPTLDKDGRGFVYNFTNYKIKTKNVVFKENNRFKELLSNNDNWIYTAPFRLSKSKTHNYYVLSYGNLDIDMCDNSILDMYCNNPLADDDTEDNDDSDCDCDWGCDKCIYTALKKKKGADIRYRKMIGLSMKKI